MGWLSTRLVIARAMAHGLFRDSGAMAMAFVLPPVVFLIFAFIFSRAGTSDLEVAVAMADTVGTQTSAALVDAIADAPTVRPVGEVAARRADIEGIVRRGVADVGLVLVPAGTPGAPARFVILEAPNRELAAVVLQGTLDGIVEEGAPPRLRLTEREAIGPPSQVPASIPYYAAAVALLFLLLSSVQGALTLQEERESGLFDRLSCGPQGVAPVVEGKFLFLTLQGVVQTGLIFLTAMFGFGLALDGVWALWAGTTVLCAAAAAALGLWVVCLCRTRRQAQTMGNILVLVLSALGGSMVPRFLMPPDMQAVGWVTPNTWGLEAYASFIWRGEGIDALIVPWSLLSVSALVGIAITRGLVRAWR